MMMDTPALPPALAPAWLANLPAALAVYAGDTGACLHANAMLANIAGGSVPALLAQNFRHLASWQESGLTAAAEATLEDGQSRRHEVSMQTSFGKAVFLDCFLSRLIFKGGAHLLLIVSDITERKQTERALTLREQEYHTLLDTIPDFIVRYDRELRRTYVNPAWEKGSGLTAREVINVPAAAIPKVPTPVHLEYLQKIRTVLMTGMPQSIGFSWVNASGAELYLEYVIVPEHDRNGAITGVLAVGRDLSERKRAEEALQESEERFRSLVNQAADAFFLHDLTGRILDVNRMACQSLGYTREELLSMDVAGVDAEFISHDHVRNFWSKLTPDHPVTLEGVHKRKDGATFPVEVHLGLFQLEGSPVILALARDITERKAAEMALKQLNEELERRVKERTAELEKNNEELERMNRLFVGRELRMVELKKRIRALEESSGRRGS